MTIAQEISIALFGLTQYILNRLIILLDDLEMDLVTKPFFTLNHGIKHDIPNPTVIFLSAKLLTTRWVSRLPRQLIGEVLERYDKVYEEDRKTWHGPQA